MEDMEVDINNSVSVLFHLTIKDDQTNCEILEDIHLAVALPCMQDGKVHIKANASNPLPLYRIN